MNILIGQNGSGKSNLLKAFALFNSIPEEFPKSLRRAGSASDFLFRGKGAKDQIEIGVEFENPAGVVPMVYSLSFSVPSGIPTIEDERVEDAVKRKPGKDVYSYYRFQGGKPVLNSPRASKL